MLFHYANDSHVFGRSRADASGLHENHYIGLRAFLHKKAARYGAGQTGAASGSLEWYAGGSVDKPSAEPVGNRLHEQIKVQSRNDDGYRPSRYFQPETVGEFAHLRLVARELHERDDRERKLERQDDLA